jgi:serine/threonine protein kinase/Tfp pilus assembly protein PilF
MTRRVRAASHETVREDKSVAFVAARRLASQILSRWQKGERADAQTALQRHPELRQYRSIALNLVYEDYCQRLEYGEAIDPDAFAAQFPEWRTAVRRQIEVHSYLAKRPDLSGPETPPDWPSPGNRFLGFDLQEELGRGAIARVYLAKEPAVGDRVVALKVSPGGAAEAKILGRLAHPNIVPVLSVGNEEASGLSAVCMPYRGRLTFAEIIAELFSGGKRPVCARELNDAIARLSQSDAARPAVIPNCRRGSYVDAVLVLLAQLADALAYTHGREMLHRDLKPSNILLSTDGTPMLLDFNLSADKHKTISRIGGTLPYMSPEQIRQAMFFPSSPGDAQEEVDGRTDIYSLGVIAYELLTGVQPFEDFAEAPFSTASAQQLLNRQAGDVPPVSQINPQVNRHISDLVAQCMSFTSAARPASAADLHGRICKLLSLHRRAQRWVRHHWVASTVATVVLLAAIAAGSTWYATRPTTWQVAVELLNAGNTAAAEQKFQSVVDENPRSALAWFALGRAQLKNEPRAAAARRSFEKAQSLCHDPRLLSVMAYCDGVDGNPRAADVYFRKAIEAGDRDAIAFYNRGVALRFSSFIAYHSAIVCCNEAINIDGELTEAYHLRGLLRFLVVSNGQANDVERRDKLGEALGDLMHASERAPEYAQYHYDVARVAAQLVKSKEDKHYSIVAEHLAYAVERGWPLSPIQGDPQLTNCLSAERLKEILERTQRATPRLNAPTYLLPALLRCDLPDEYNADWQQGMISDS